MKVVKEIQPKLRFAVLTPEERRQVLSVSNPDNPFSNFIGNEEVVSKVNRYLYAALGDEHHYVELRLALLGPSGTGKTTVANGIAVLLDLPFANVDAGSVTSSQDLFEQIRQTAEEMAFEFPDGRVVNLALRPQENEKCFQAPPMVVFIDECHLLDKDVEQALLTATDSNVNRLVTKQGVVLDTSNIIWIIATTESGDLFHAFKTRFSKVQFRSYTKDQLAKIVQKRTNLPWEVCSVAAKYYFVTREAIDFANEVELEYKMNGGSWDDAIETIRKEHRIDEYGMQERHLIMLKALLKNGVMSRDRLTTVLKCQAEELRKEILPPLLEYSEDGREPLVESSSKGVKLTDAGREELKKRGLV